MNFVAEVAPTEESKIEFLIRRNATYAEINMDSLGIGREIAKNKAPEEVIVLEGAKEKIGDYWEANRTEPLNKSEILAKSTIDTLWKMPLFIKIVDGIKLLESGFLDVGKFRVGRFWSILGRNPFNGPRLRLELSNNEKLSRNFNFQTNLTINAREQMFNGGLQLKYIFNHKWWSEINFLVSDNIDLGGYDNKIDLVSKDNIFVNTLRRRDVHFRIHEMLQGELNYYKKFPSGWGVEVSGSYQKFTPIYRDYFETEINPDLSKGRFQLHGEGAMTNCAFSLGVNYSYLEKFIENRYKRLSLGSRFPIVSLLYTKGLQGVFGSQYDYDKLKIGFQQIIKREPFGTLKIDVEAGKIFGKLPYMILERPYANLTMYYLKNYFNTVKPYEYITDEYLKWHIEHHLGLGFFRFIPLLKKWKWRQIWMMNGMMGSVDGGTLAYNNGLLKNTTYKDFKGDPLIEMGVGIDNILSVLRLSYFWRVTPTKQTSPQTFMLSFHIQF